MADLLKEVEAIPENYPEATLGASDLGAMVDRGVIWERIESYIRTRYSERTVTWVFEARAGEDWAPPLSPVVSYSSDKWEAGAWVAIGIAEGPVGYCIPSDGTFRVTAQVGAGPVPHGVSEAFDRLAKYVSAIQRTPGDRLAMRTVSLNPNTDRPSMVPPSQEAVRVAEVDGSVDYLSNWPARALQLSGAADLLRPYRRQK